jgi:hypothetical protein
MDVGLGYYAQESCGVEFVGPCAGNLFFPSCFRVGG